MEERRKPQGLRDMLQETHDSTIRQEGAIDAIRQDLADGDRRFRRLEHMVFGNGQPGMVERLGDVEKWKRLRQKLEWLVIAAAVPVLVGAAATGIWWVIRAMP